MSCGRLCCGGCFATADKRCLPGGTSDNFLEVEDVSGRQTFTGDRSRSAGHCGHVGEDAALASGDAVTVGIQYVGGSVP